MSLLVPAVTSKFRLSCCVQFLTYGILIKQLRYISIKFRKGNDRKFWNFENYEKAKDQGAWTMSRGNGATYTHWGKTNCSSVAETMSKGSVLGPSGDGGGANFLCLPDKPEFGDPPANQKEAAALQVTSYQFPNGKNMKLSCSNCRLASRGTVQMFVARTQCPDDWDFVYEGILMSGSRNSISTNFVCLDKNPEDGDELETRNPLVPDWAVVPTDNEDDDEENQLLFTCVVCAK